MKFVKIPGVRLVDITITHDDGSQHRHITVASDHPDLYRLAQDAERDGDRAMIRAVAKAATEDVVIGLRVGADPA